MFLLLFKIIRHRCLAWVLLGVLALTGCSAVRFGYEQAPSLAYWWLDGQVDFSGEQTPRARDMLDRLQRWHRRSELRPYADLLSRAAGLAEGSVTTEQACQLTQEVQQSLNVFMRETIRLAAPVAATIELRQIRHLGQHQEQKNTKWEEQWLQGPDASRLQYRLDKLVDRYADFYGSLSDAQVKLLRQQIEQSVWTPQWGRQERLRQQRDLLNALMRIEQDKPGARQTEEILLGVWTRWMQPPSEADRQRWQNWLAQGCKQMAELHNSTSAEQRQRAARRLRAYEADFRELASRP